MDLWPRSSASGGGKSFSTDCMLPEEARGAKLQLGLLVGAKTEKLSYEFLDVPAPR